MIRVLLHGFPAESGTRFLEISRCAARGWNATKSGDLARRPAFLRETNIYVDFPAPFWPMMMLLMVIIVIKVMTIITILVIMMMIMMMMRPIQPWQGRHLCRYADP